MPVLNRIGKIRKRNHALVTFDPAKILRAIKRGANSAGGFAPDYLPEINEKIFAAGGTDHGIAEFLADL
ncbi:hypothetical protein KAR02_00565, partial [Candidatus Bipolaricaulota bacterium]|nr:hypothetical protein [Candidatus Bipolaricaulota bacterium]